MKFARFRFITPFVRFLWWTAELALRAVYHPRLRFVSDKAKEAFKSPCILIANHRSHLDGAYLPLALRRLRPWTYVAKDWYEKKKIRWLFSNLRYMPMNRHEMDTAWLEMGEEVIGKGKSVLIFPEGKLGHAAAPDAFKPGFLMLARRTGVPVIPVAMIGPYRKFHRNTVLVGEPSVIDVTRPGRPSLLFREGAITCREELCRLMGVDPALPEAEKAEDGASAEPAKG